MNAEGLLSGSDRAADAAGVARDGYRQAVDTASKARALIARWPELAGDKSAAGNPEEPRELQDAMTYLCIKARVSTKLGRISARVGDHYPALVRCQKELYLNLALISRKLTCRLIFHLAPCPSFCFSMQNEFGDAIAAWAEAAATMRPQDSTTTNATPSRLQTNDVENIDDLLNLKTRDAILSFGVAETLTRIPMYAVDFLKNTMHLADVKLFEALSAGLALARSHHAIGAEVVAGEEVAMTNMKEASDKYKVAINHHLLALQIIYEIRRLRTSSHMLSLDERRSTNSLMGGIKATHLEGCNLSVSCEGIVFIPF